MPRTSRLALGVGAHRDDDGDGDDAACLARLHVGRVDPEIRPVALDRAGEEGLDLVVDLFAQPADLALGDAAAAHRLDEVVHRAGGDSLDVGLLDHRCERLLGQPAGLQEPREVRPLAQLGDAQLDRPGPGLPVPVPVAVALDQPLGALLAMGRPGQGAHLQLHQPLGRKADHLPQHVGVRALFHQPAQGHHLVGHPRFLGHG